mmetsp:Transcript_80969/g.147744  ORF Transcript_80969/g.147744 Transcript_80969/m.147744 type:complete len:274 (-) Transcript_80969:689-1510(-)
MVASSSATALDSSAMLSVSCAMEAVSSSISAVNFSTVSVFSLRVCSLTASSVSHQPLCSASSFASFMRRTIKSLIIFLTFWKGSSEICAATLASMRLLRCEACLRKKAATRAWACVVLTARSIASAVPLLVSVFCSMLGKYVSALPDTELLAMIEMAFSMASSSSARNSCLDSKSEAFCAHVASISVLYLVSAAKTSLVSVRSPSASAFFCNSLALSSDFFVASDSALLIMLSRSAMSISYACLDFISFFSRSVRFSVKSSSNFSSISITPED